MKRDTHRSITRLFVVTAFLAISPCAWAGFTVTSIVTPVSSGPNQGDFVVKFYATNDGVGGTGTKLMHVSSTLVTDTHFIFRFANLDPDNVLDADVLQSPGATFNYGDNTGQQINTRTTAPFSTVSTSPNIGTSIRPNGTGANAANFVAQTIVPGNPSSNPTVVKDAVNSNLVFSATPTIDPTLTYNNTSIKLFTVSGAYLSAADAPLATGVGTSGSLFAIALVPAGTQFVAITNTQLQGETGPIANVPDIFPYPEPTSIALISIAALFVCGTRRRSLV